MSDRSKKGTPGEESEKAAEARPAPGGFGRRRTPVGGSTPPETPPDPPALPKEVGNRVKVIGQASDKIGKLLMQAYRDERGIHIETIVGAAAVLAGEFALRASVPRLPDTGWIAGGP